MVRITETPRDGLQGLKHWVPTDLKVEYINALLRVGFDIVEVGSFASPQVIPQMRDTAQVLERLDLSRSRSKTMVLVADARWGERACQFEQVDYISYPFSTSPTFLKRNLNATIDSAIENISRLLEICGKTNKELIVYFSMSFGNPYGDPWGPEIVLKWAKFLFSMGIRVFSLTDIMGDVTPLRIRAIYEVLVPSLPEAEFGLHLHTGPDDFFDKVDAAYRCGVRRFDTVLAGFGGCPMASDKLVGNLNTMDMLDYLERTGQSPPLNVEWIAEARRILEKVL